MGNKGRSNTSRPGECSLRDSGSREASYPLVKQIIGKKIERFKCSIYFFLGPTWGFFNFREPVFRPSVVELSPPSFVACSILRAMGRDVCRVHRGPVSANIGAAVVCPNPMFVRRASLIVRLSEDGRRSKANGRHYKK
jgi:hypothetical protein